MSDYINKREGELSQTLVNKKSSSNDIRIPLSGLTEPPGEGTSKRKDLLPKRPYHATLKGGVQSRDPSDDQVDGQILQISSSHLYL